MTKSVAYQGVAGAYSEQAARLFFNREKIATVPSETFTDVFTALAKQTVTNICIPVENTLTGSILENYHLLRECDGVIIGEVMVKISHALLALPGATVDTLRSVLSHPQALLQCRDFFQKHPNIKPKAAFDTAGSAQQIAKKGKVNIGAIASTFAANLYGLAVLQTDIQKEKYNYTRFLIVQKEAKKIKGNKATLMYELQHAPGTLQKSLTPFAQNGVNVMKIEAIPIAGRPWEYYFFLDVESESEKNIHQALMEFKKACTWFKMLGLYDKGRIYEN